MTTRTTPILTARAARRGRLSAITVIAAGALMFTPMTAPAQVPGGPTSPPGSAPPRPTPPPPPPAQPPPPAPPAPPAPPPPPAPAPEVAAPQPEPAPDQPAPATQVPVSAAPPPPQLTQIYRGNDGGVLYLRAEGTTVVGFAENPVKSYAFVFRGTRTKNVINGNWYDVAKGTRQTTGAIQLKMFKNGDRLVRSGGKDFGPDVFTATAASKIPWPGGQEAGFQARVTSDLDGAFVGKGAGVNPDGSRLYWTDTTSFGPIGVAEGPRALGMTRPRWVSVFFGKRDAQGKIAGEYFDVPKGTETERGVFRIYGYKAQYGRRYGLQQFDSAHAGLVGRPHVFDADYAINFDTFAAAVDKFFRNNVVGFGYAISRNGKVVRSDAGGNAYLAVPKGFDGPQQFRTATQSDIGSSSKLVVATAVMKELEARGMSVGSEVASYFPSCWDLGDGWDDMTFRRLLKHTSGLVRPGASVLEKDKTGYLFQKTVAQTAVAGQKYAYENQNYVMLGWILAGMLDKPKVEASFEKHGCGKGTPAMLETMQIFEAYVVDMLDDQGVEGTWQWREGAAAFPYNFENPTRTDSRTGEGINPSGGLKMSADELGEFMAKLENGRFVKRSTVEMMKDLRLGVDGVVDAKALGHIAQKGGAAPLGSRGYGSRVTMMPGDVQVVGVWNSTRNAVTSSSADAFLAAWRSAIK